MCPQGRIGPNVHGVLLGASGERFRDPFDREGGATPGPGAYDLARTAAIRLGGGALFGSEERKSEAARGIPLEPSSPEPETRNPGSVSSRDHSRLEKCVF